MLVTLDTLRYDALVPESGGEPAMPLLLHRARRGTLFERFYASTSLTQPSHASMLTALHPWEHGITRNGQVLDDGVATVAEILRERGFATAAVVASFPLASRFGFAQGFDAFEEVFTEGPVPERRWMGHEVPRGRFYSMADTITDRALEVVEELGRRRDGAGDEFLWVHYFDPHEPYGDTLDDDPLFDPTRAYHAIEEGKDVEPLLRQFRLAYDRDVAFLDGEIDRLVEALDTGAHQIHVVVASDHGESFGEGGAIAHGKRVTDEQTRVPLVILSPRVEPRTRSDVAGSVDVARTLLSLAGVEVMPEPFSAARDLTSLETGPGGALGMRSTFSPRQTELRTDGSRHPLGEPLFFAVDREGSLFRGNGSGLTHRPPRSDPAIAEGVRRLFRGLEERVARGGAPIAPDDDVREGLRALGYLD